MDQRINLANKLKKLDPSKLNMVIGFDGFIDEIIHVVDKRYDSENFKRIETISQLARRIENASGLSTNIELVSTLKKIGGNGPIMANALSVNNPNITYIGSLGTKEVNNVFSPMKERMTLYTIAQNGHTDALEFNDGKLMLGKMSSLKDVTYERMMEVVGFDNMLSLLNQADLFATVNWSMLPNMTKMYQKMQEKLLPKLTKKVEKPYMFIDLADPEKREDEEILEVLRVLPGFNEYFKVVLGLNKKEAYEIAGVLNLFAKEDLKNMQISLQDVTFKLYSAIGIYGIVVHPVDRSSVVIDGIYYEEEGPFIAKPKLSTGAGDNFNAGFMLGLLLGLSPNEALLVGMGTSGYYVRFAKSPNKDSLIQFLIDWSNNRI
jgi:hypothetical protein